MEWYKRGIRRLFGALSPEEYSGVEVKSRMISALGNVKEKIAPIVTNKYVKAGAATLATIFFGKGYFDYMNNVYSKLSTPAIFPDNTMLAFWAMATVASLYWAGVWGLNLFYSRKSPTK